MGLSVCTVRACDATVALFRDGRLPKEDPRQFIDQLNLHPFPQEGNREKSTAEE